jgi:hypothetical protein
MSFSNIQAVAKRLLKLARTVRPDGGPDASQVGVALDAATDRCLAALELEGADPAELQPVIDVAAGDFMPAMGLVRVLLLTRG